MTRSKGLLLPDVQKENYSLEMRHDDIGNTANRSPPGSGTPENHPLYRGRQKAKRPFQAVQNQLTAHSRAEEKVLYRGMEKSEEGKDDALLKARSSIRSWIV